VLVEDYLKPLLEAHETKFFQFQGQVVERVNVVAWGPRKEGLDIAFRLKGSYAPKSADEIEAGNITINISAMPRPAHA
jgi:hypothetical protein